jgi:peptidoglycan/LPS O-acetylase OafA/YrhL
MKLTHVDSLRGIAILMVILVHSASGVQFVLSEKNQQGLPYLVDVIAQYGQMGVQLFFVVSAFTLCLSTANRAGEHLQYVNFFIRRFFRIAPLYYFGIIYYAYSRAFFNYIKAGELLIPEHYTSFNIISNVLFFHGFYPPANTNIVLGGWSIGTEMAFYLVFPILFFIAKQLQDLPVIVLILFAGMLVAGDFYLMQYTESVFGLRMGNNGFIYYNLANQILVFMTGISLYFLERKKIMHQWTWWLDMFIFLLLSAAGIFVWKLELTYSFFFIPILAGVSFVFLYNVFRKNDHLNIGLLRKIGQLSFSMYVFHFVFAYQLTGFVANKLFPYLPNVVLLVVCYLAAVAMTMAVAFVTEKWIEKPGIHLGRLIIKKITVTR